MIDLDEIIGRLSGLPRNSPSRHHWLARALRERNAQLAGLSSSVAPHAWFIVSAPKAESRERWQQMLGAQQVVVLEVDPIECQIRIEADLSRDHQTDRDTIIKWWHTYQKRERDVILM